MELGDHRGSGRLLQMFRSIVFSIYEVINVPKLSLIPKYPSAIVMKSSSRTLTRAALEPKCVNGYTMVTPESTLTPIAAAVARKNVCYDPVFGYSYSSDSLLSLETPYLFLIAELRCREIGVSDL
jgi:hypothetical protein